MKHPADEVFTHVIGSLADEELEFLVDVGEHGPFAIAMKLAQARTILECRQAWICPWMH